MKSWAKPEWGIDFEAEVVVVTGDLQQGATPEEVAKAIRLIMLVNDVSLRGLIPAEFGKRFRLLPKQTGQRVQPDCGDPR